MPTKAVIHIESMAPAPPIFAYSCFMDIKNVYTAYMSTHRKSFFAGIGSVIAIYPSVSYSKYVPRSNPEDRIRDCWEKTGSQLRSALADYEEQSNVKVKVKKEENQ